MLVTSTIDCLTHLQQLLAHALQDNAKKILESLLLDVYSTAVFLECCSFNLRFVSLYAECCFCRVVQLLCRNQRLFWWLDCFKATKLLQLRIRLLYDRCTDEVTSSLNIFCINIFFILTRNTCLFFTRKNLMQYCYIKH